MYLDRLRFAGECARPKTPLLSGYVAVFTLFFTLILCWWSNSQHRLTSIANNKFNRENLLIEQHTRADLDIPNEREMMRDDESGIVGTSAFDGGVNKRVKFRCFFETREFPQ